MTEETKRGMIGFVTAELLLYLIFMTGDIFGYPGLDTVTLVKYCSILLCNVFTLTYALKYRRRENFILSGGLFFTAVSDYFLLFTDNFTFGMLTFCAVQILYLVYLYFLGERRRGVAGRLLVNILLWAAALLILLILQLPVSLLLITAAFYFISILHNVITAVGNVRHKFSNRNLIFAVGMILFLLCDINVGIYNMDGFITVESMTFQKLYHFSEIAMWMFYLPAQVCISISGIFKE
ncbi:lysoplasmalogenase family protein [Anaerocolumna chitinilytica]|uniref:YhhN-like protein n=1 Tax=Anaerocolumna chitinilytica TaxID=1727145 RepID=A0A7I8DQK4_9FIRM|nr:lysoplasmalogenase family protein [Anaerocolumna chitinilytica]BCJ99947.1 hypothetical protein bsdcttw_29880 [Anaerocolumna chitinilytica]